MMITDALPQTVTNREVWCEEVPKNGQAQESAAFWVPCAERSRFRCACE